MNKILQYFSIALMTICFSKVVFAQTASYIHIGVNQSPCNTTSITEYNYLDLFSIYPNPINETFRIELVKNNPSAVKITVCITNVLDEMVLQLDELTTNGKYSREVDFSNQPQGVYFISIRENGTIRFVQKIIKK
jgi:hypothetical protein